MPARHRRWDARRGPVPAVRAPPAAAACRRRADRAHRHRPAARWRRHRPGRRGRRAARSCEEVHDARNGSRIARQFAVPLALGGEQLRCRQELRGAAQRCGHRARCRRRGSCTSSIRCRNVAGAWHGREVRLALRESAAGSAARSRLFGGARTVPGHRMNLASRNSAPEGMLIEHHGAQMRRPSPVHRPCGGRRWPVRRANVRSAPAVARSGRWSRPGLP